jgi:hypothetical protein
MGWSRELVTISRGRLLVLGLGLGLSLALCAYALAVLVHPLLIGPVSGRVALGFGILLTIVVTIRAGYELHYRLRRRARLRRMRERDR